MPEEREYREVEEETRTVECEANKFNQIVLKNFVFSTELIISEIAIFNKITSKYILYTLSADSVFDGEGYRINDGSISTSAFTVKNDTLFILNFDQHYYFSDIEVGVYLTDNKLNTDSFKISFLQNNRYPVSQKILIVNAATSGCFLSKCKMTINPDTSWNNQTIFIDNYYRFRDKLFKYYDLKRVYLDEYLINADGYFKDESQSKIFYRYKINKPLEVSTSSDLKFPIIKKKYFNNSLENTNNDEEVVNEIKMERKEKVVVVKSDENKNNGFFIKIFVSLSLILTVFFIISKNLYKKSKISRTI